MDSARTGAHRVRQEGDEMPEHKIGTREEWQAARDELAGLEAGQAERNEELNRKRLGLPGLHRPGRRARRRAGPPEPPRRHAGLLLTGADRPADRLQAADGLAVPL